MSTRFAASHGETVNLWKKLDLALGGYPLVGLKSEGEVMVLGRSEVSALLNICASREYVTNWLRLPM